MKLTLEDIKSITHGAVSITETERGYSFFRFNNDELKLYKSRKLYAGCDFDKKSYSTSGVQFEFKTDATKLFLSGSISVASSRKYYAFDVFVNGRFAGDVRNYRVDDMVPNIPQMIFHFPISL